MKTAPILFLASLLMAMALPARAAQQVQRDTRAAHAEQVQQKQIVDLRNAPRQRDGKFSYAIGDGYGGTNGPYANPYRTYPPSCMADPLPMTPAGTLSKQMDMAAYNQNLQGYVREPVTVTIWQLGCSSSANSPWGDSAITLLRIQRSSNHEGDNNQYVVFPGVRVAQGSVDFDDAQGDDLPRLAPEPNTIVSWTPVDSAMVDSTTYVLEDYPISTRPYLDYTQSFKLRMDNFINDGKTHQYVIDVPAYVPTDFSSNPPGLEGMPINGYMTNNYYDPTHSGEGMMVQVYELPSSGLYALQFNWFTFGPDGKPFWISGDAQVQPGARSVTAQAGYRDGGGFAGDFGSQAPGHSWGTITFQWNNCNRMQFSYQSQSGLPAFVPQGNGTRTWNRLGNTNGLTCE